MRPELSIILPVYNGEKYIERCIESILSNTFKDYELIVINDGSTDYTQNICDSYAERDERIKVFHNSNHGVSWSRNFGIEKSNGNWISFVDSDDWLSENAFETIFNIQSEECDIISFGFWSVSDKHKSKIRLPEINKGKTHYIRQQLLLGWTVVWNVWFRKEFLNEHSLRFNNELSIGEDSEFLFRAYFYARGIRVVNEALYFYNRTNEESALHRMNKSHYDEIISANISIAQFFKDNNVYENFKDIMAWKILRAKQDYVLDVKTHDKFLAIYPECHKYIISCPTIGKKIKLMMWFLTHRLGFITKQIVYVRNLYRKQEMN